jgi:hypothetical protein
MTHEEKIASLLMGLWPDSTGTQEGADMTALFLHWVKVEFAELARLSAELVNRIESINQSAQLAFDVHCSRAWADYWKIDLVVYSKICTEEELQQIWADEKKRSEAERAAVTVAEVSP